jgi:hypothetical protein
MPPLDRRSRVGGGEKGPRMDAVVRLSESALKPPLDLAELFHLTSTHFEY